MSYHGHGVHDISAALDRPGVRCENRRTARPDAACLRNIIIVGGSRGARRLPVYQRIGVRRASGQGVRPHLRCRGRCLPGGRFQRTGGLRDAGHDQPDGARRRGARPRLDHRRGPGVHRADLRPRDRLRAGGLPLGQGRRGGPCSRPVGRHRPRRGPGRQQGPGRRRSGHHVRLRLPRDRRAHAGTAPLCPRDPGRAGRAPGTPAMRRASGPIPRAR